MNELTKPEKMAAFFNQRAPGYEAHMKESITYEADKIQLAEQIAITSNVVKVLDLGCGTGLEIEYILQRTPHAQFVCMDIAENMLELLKIKYQDYLQQIKILKASYLDYDFGTNLYDYVVACSTMHHWVYDQKLNIYRRIYNSLKPGGKYIDDDYLVPEDKEREALDNYNQFKRSGMIENGEFYHIDIPFSVTTESQVLAEAGFCNVKTIYEHYSEQHCGALLVAFKE